MANPMEKVRIMKDKFGARLRVESCKKKMMAKPVREPINDPIRLPIEDSVKSERAISHLLAPKAIKISTRYALRKIALKMTSDIAKTDKTNVMDTTIYRIISLVS